MIEVNIEKEINVKNKIFKGLNLRQIIGIIIGVISGIIIYLISGVPFSESYYCFMATGIVAYFIGWYNKDNLYVESIAKKRFETFLYKNTKRKYRTQNQYIKMYNAKYRKMRNADMNNKQIQKCMKKDKKILEKEKKSSKIHGYA